MDFGLARSLESDGMTQTGALVGTMEYMSPEQAMGKQLDQRSDIFALGLIFYRTADRQDAVQGGHRRGESAEAQPGTGDSGCPRSGRFGSERLERHCQQVSGARREQALSNVQEIVADLDAWQGNRPMSASMSGTLRALARP